MFYKSNILALVGGGSNPKFSLNKVILWDDHQGKVISEIRVNTNIKNVKFKMDKIFIVCQKKIYVYNTKNLDLIEEPIETYNNPNGIIALSYNKNITIMSYPYKQKGHVHIKSYEKDIKNQIINCHNSEINCISINNDGTLIATASQIGTLLRIFNIKDGNFLLELRRGADKAIIFSISFEINNKFFACTSDKGTIHIYSLYTANQTLVGRNTDIYIRNPQNKKRLFDTISNILFNKNTEYSFAKFKINENKSICQFGLNNKILVLTSSGQYYQVPFDPYEGGQCTEGTVYNLKRNKKK